LPRGPINYARIPQISDLFVPSIVNRNPEIMHAPATRSLESRKFRLTDINCSRRRPPRQSTLQSTDFSGTLTADGPDHWTAARVSFSSIFAAWRFRGFGGARSSNQRRASKDLG
jgi:hypothetical protein